MAQGRQNALQCVHYARFTVRFNDAGIAGGVGKQWLPKGAVLIGTDVFVKTPFNAVTTNDVVVGLAGLANNIVVASGDVTESAAALLQNIKPTGAALGPLADDSQLTVTYTQTGGAATAGEAVVIVKYIPANDL